MKTFKKPNHSPLNQPHLNKMSTISKKILISVIFIILACHATIQVYACHPCLIQNAYAVDVEIEENALPTIAVDDMSANQQYLSQYQY